jgi:hypothetical protein
LAIQVGPALVYLTFDSIFGRGAFTQSILPIAPLEQLVTHEVWAESRLPTFIAKFFLKGEAMQVLLIFIRYSEVTEHFSPSLLGRTRYHDLE